MNSLPEHPKLLKTTAYIQAPKFSFQLNHIKLPIGVEGTFGLIRHPGASLAVPITTKGTIIILRQYRFAIAKRILEFPAGTLEEGEEPLNTMKRELAEETGFQASTWRPMGTMLPCPGYSDEIIHLFLAQDLDKLTERPKGDLDEDIEVLELSSKEFDEIISSGNEALDGKTITAWYKAKTILGI